MKVGSVHAPLHHHTLLPSSFPRTPPSHLALISIYLTSPLTDHSSVKSEWARHFRHSFSLCQANLQLLLFTSTFPVKVLSPHPPHPHSFHTNLPTASAPTTFSCLSLTNYASEWLQLVLNTPRLIRGQLTAARRVKEEMQK